MRVLAILLPSLLLLTGCGHLLAAGMRLDCKINGDLSPEDKRLIDTAPHQWPVQVEYERDGAVRSQSALWVCERPHVAYSIGCANYSVEWEQGWQAQPIAFGEGAAAVNLEVPLLCNGSSFAELRSSDNHRIAAARLHSEQGVRILGLRAQVEGAWVPLKLSDPDPEQVEPPLPSP